METMNIKKEDLRWTGQTVHQGYHHHIKGTFEKCSMSICDFIRQILERGADEYGADKKENRS